MGSASAWTPVADTSAWTPVVENNRRMGAAEAIKGLTEGAGDVASGALKSLRHPIDALSSIWHNMQSEADRSAQSLNKGDFLKAAQHAAGVFPVLGPALDSVADAIDDKVDDRELGQRVGRALTMIVAPDAARKALDIAKSAGTAVSTIKRVVTDPDVIREGIKIVPKGAQMLKFHDVIKSAANGSTETAPPVVEEVGGMAMKDLDAFAQKSGFKNYDEVPKDYKASLVNLARTDLAHPKTTPVARAATPAEDLSAAQSPQGLEVPIEQPAAPYRPEITHVGGRPVRPPLRSPAAHSPAVEPAAGVNPEVAAPAAEPNAGGSRTRLDMILDTVKPSQHEVTFDVRDYAEADKSRIIKAAEDRGLNAASDGKHILVRDLGASAEPKTELEYLLERSLNGEKVAEQAKAELNDHLKLEALKKTESIIDKHQTTRALKLGRFLQDYGITPEHIEKMTPEEWQQVGSVAEVENPSATTIEKTKALLKMGQAE